MQKRSDGGIQKNAPDMIEMSAGHRSQKEGGLDPKEPASDPSLELRIETSEVITNVR